MTFMDVLNAITIVGGLLGAAFFAMQVLEENNPKTRLGKIAAVVGFFLLGLLGFMSTGSR